MSDYVFRGFWTNWEDGKVRGATLTLPQTQGLILVSFLTLFVQFSGVCFWRVICFMLHQIRSTTEAKDGLYHQQQAILRNGITAPYVLWSLIQMAMAWKGKVSSALKHSSGLLSFTIIHILFFAAAGLFSSQVTSTGANAALVRSDKCGFPQEVPNLHDAEPSKMSPATLLDLNTAALLGRITLFKSSSYVRTCFTDTSNTGTATCDVYAQPYLHGIGASNVLNASCPFGGGACRTPFAARYDSGFLHSGDDLGINIPDSHSLSFRRVTTCAPIKGDEKYATDWIHNVPESLVGNTTTSVKYYEFGRSLSREPQCEATTQLLNNTAFCISKYQQAIGREAYTIYSNTAYYNYPNASDFDPIPDFRVKNADVTIAGIMNKANYAGNVTDPLFEALVPSSRSNQFYTPSQNMSFLGCTEQYQLCNTKDPKDGKCTELTGLYGVSQAIERGDLPLSSLQRAVYKVMWKAAWAMSHQWAFRVLDRNVLLAQDWVLTSRSLSSSQLPPNQWEIESHNLHNLSLAVFQRRVNEYARPENFPIRPTVSSWDLIKEENDPDLRALCGAQRIRSTSHYSVNVLGMGVILIVGGILVVLDWTIVSQVFWFRSYTNAPASKKFEWTSTGTLQLLRQALQPRVGPWNTNNYEFPTLVARGEKFTGFGTQPDRIQLGPVQGGWSYGDTQYQGARYESVEQGDGMDQKDKK